MSGTSGDGVDAALVSIGGSGLDMTAKFIAQHHVPFAPSVKSLLFSIRESGNCQLSDLAKLGRDISLLYVDAIQAVLQATGTLPGDVACVAAHGQTLYHSPPNTIQYFDPSLVAYEVGCPVVSDFRRADCAAGGQGAPLVPFADYILFHHPEKSRVLLNIGGIANLTFLKAGGTLEEVIAFDTGPGNCISDALCRRNLPEGLGYDHAGAISASGIAHSSVVERCLQNDYFHRPPPKSTDGPAMIQLFDEAIRRHAPSLNLPDQLATAIELTARSVAGAIPEDVEVFASGGGCYNQALMHWFIDAGLKLQPIGHSGVDVDACGKEAVAFAILGAATLDGVPGNVPSVTGAKRGVVLGSITPKP